MSTYMYVCHRGRPRENYEKWKAEEGGRGERFEEEEKEKKEEQETGGAGAYNKGGFGVARGRGQAPEGGAFSTPQPPHVKSELGHENGGKERKNQFTSGHD